MLNKVMIIGRLGRDPELRYAQNGTPIANLRIATDESYVDREGNKVDRVEWHTVVVFQRAAENCANFLGKGSLVFVEGSLQTRKWQDQQGQDRYSTEIKAQRVQFLDRRGEAAQQGEDGGSPRRSFNPTGGRGGQSGQGGQGGRQQNRNNDMGNQAYDDDLGPAFPSEASGMDDVPF
ncbi:single-stranded DNA-binding protein [Nitratidesulfovibrio vulgaris]|jgi:single-strand DNA-binding protein|uniref:Single-stranded DNA-binding protein n=2 Tax=Nitratidesulfovibrio vulgaris TaxID=881 RepID=Q729X5_NITV2|nr:single-stranded DNA-binding protein [Nitratidesulfovibrio vulgaris]GEB80619.1 single-stranded DNA-binding protein [Desulfovibrio desulfuricans]HBW16675.1 single-stranded DNA-binding protein [Desulfovibrio sp.]AAS96695.1 single-strand binding protein [Nitratidesulfovibrio vulgaris str. Hildenborough]ABM28039.1 single-strand binding protein [Nitratidesulfovibrio vulgaris DP4]ADP87212.1 single-strand binding protein [Nitratidesulfovibrio vulgaris RCH1]